MTRIRVLNRFQSAWQSARNSGIVQLARNHPKTSIGGGVLGLAVLGLAAYGAYGLLFSSDEDDCASSTAPIEEVVSLDYGVDLNRNGTLDQQLSFFLKSKEEVHLFDDALASGDPLFVINKNDYETRRHAATDEEKTFFNDSFAQRLGYAFNDLATRIQKVSDGKSAEDLRLRSSVSSQSLVDILEVLDASGKSLFKVAVRQEAPAQGSTDPILHYTLEHLNLDGPNGRVRVKNDANNDVDALIRGDVRDAYDLLTSTVQGIYASQESAVSAHLSTAMQHYQYTVRSGSAAGSGSPTGTLLTRPIAPKTK